MRWLVPTVALAVASVTLPAAPAVQCPGDLNGDGVVTINEIVKVVNAALDGCTADPCPGDLNGDHVVMVDEIITAIIAALHGCTSTPTPTPTVGHCPYTFTDDTLSLGASCAYSGAFSSNPTCSTDLSALVLSDPTEGNLVAVSVGSSPIITFGGVASSTTDATIVAYFIGDDLTPQPLTGIMQLTNDGNTLIIDPDTVPDFNIGGIDCSFDRYVGTFTHVASDQARRRAPRGAAYFNALRATLAARVSSPTP